MENNKYLSASTKKKRTMPATGTRGGIYGLAFIWSLIYFIQHKHFFDGVPGFLKALVWPAVLIYMVMEFLKM